MKIDERHAFKVWLTEADRARLAGASRAMEGKPVYRDQTMSMQAIVIAALRRELGKLEREFNEGEPFPPAEPTRGRPRKDQR